MAVDQSLSIDRWLQILWDRGCNSCSVSLAGGQREQPLHPVVAELFDPLRICDCHSSRDSYRSDGNRSI